MGAYTVIHGLNMGARWACLLFVSCDGPNDGATWLREVCILALVSRRACRNI